MTRRALFAVACVALLALAGLVLIGVMRDAGPMSPSQQSTQLAAELRCPDCQGLSVAESHTASAAAIRGEIDRQLAAGRSVDEVRAYFVARYGDWILLEPSSPVWLMLPLLVIAAGTAALVAWLRAGRPRAPNARGAGGATGDRGPGSAAPPTSERVRDELEALDA